MNKKTLLLFFMGLFIMSIFAAGVSAASLSEVSKAISDNPVLKWLTVDLASEFAKEAGEMSDAAKTSVKLIYFFLVFAVIYGVTQIVPQLKKLPRNATMVITFIISILTAVATPHNVLVNTIKMYGSFVMFIFFGIPLLAGFYLLYSIEAESRFAYFMQVLLGSFMIYVVTKSQEIIIAMLGKGSMMNWVLGLFYYILIVFVVWGSAKLVMGTDKAGDVEKNVGRAADKGAGAVGGFFKGLTKTAAKAQEWAIREKSDIDEIQDHISADEWADAETKMNRGVRIERRLTTSIAKVTKVAKEAKKIVEEDVKKDINTKLNEANILNGQIMVKFRDVRKAVKANAAIIGKTPPGTLSPTSVTTAKDGIDTIATDLDGLIAVFEDIRDLAS